MLAFLGKLSLGLIMGLGGLGSCLGIKAAGVSAAAGWAKEGKEGKPLSGKFSGLVGMPVSQTLYCMILYLMMVPYAGVEANGGVLFGIAVGIGLAELFSASVQGMIGGAVELDGNGDYVSVPDFELATNTVTITAWINGWKAYYVEVKDEG